MDRLKKLMASWSMRRLYGIAAVVMAAASLFVYYFSPDSRVQVLACEGNYLFTDTQVYQMAGVSTATRMWLTPGFWITHKIESNPLVESASVKKSGNKMTFEVKEKNVIGYYVKDGQDYMLTSSGESVSIDPAYLRSILHFPLLSDFSDQQLAQIAAQFRDNSKYLTREVTAQIAEIVPYKASYDDNMLRITMQDGNVVFSSMDDLVMMTHYEDMLQQLQGQSVCLLLDKDNSAINKVACDYLNMSQEEREAYRAQLREEMDRKAAEKEAQEAQKKQEDKKSREKDSDSKENGEGSENGENPEKPAEDGQDQENQEQTPDLSYEAYGDWQSTEFFDYQYSPSADLYYDPNQGLFLKWDDSLQDFTVIE